MRSLVLSDIHTDSDASYLGLRRNPYQVALTQDKVTDPGLVEASDRLLVGYKEAWVKGGDGSVPSGTAYRSIQLWPRNDNSRGQTSRLPLEPTAPHDA